MVGIIQTILALAGCGTYYASQLGTTDHIQVNLRKTDCIGPYLVENDTDCNQEFCIYMGCVFYDVSTNLDPSELCKFYSIRESQKAGEHYQRRLIQKSSYLKITQTTGVDAHCSLFTPVSTPGIFKFEATFANYLPYVSCSHFELYKPEVALSDCPGGEGVKGNYVREGAEASCKCKLLRPGNPPAVVVWQEAATGLELVRGDKEAILMFSFNESSTSSYRCIAKGFMKFERKISFTPSFAYGPRSISTDIPEPMTTFNMCSNETTVRVRCCIERLSYDPDVIVHIEGFGSEVTANLTDDILWKGKRHFDFHLTPPRGGVYNATCVAFNSVFHDIRITSVTTMTIYEPPTDPPSLTIGENDPVTSDVHVEVNLTCGDVVEISCHVQGGYPAVHRVFMDSAGARDWSDGNRIRSTLTVIQSMDAKVIECSASHVTQCYNRKSSVVISVVDRLDDDCLSDDKSRVNLTIAATSSVIVVIIISIICFKWRLRKMYKTPDATEDPSPSPSEVKQQYNKRPSEGVYLTPLEGLRLLAMTRIREEEEEEEDYSRTEPIYQSIPDLTRISVTSGIGDSGGVGDA